MYLFLTKDENISFYSELPHSVLISEKKALKTDGFDPAIVFEMF